MIQCKCEQCGGEFPMNDTLRVADRTLCLPCCEQVLADQTAPRPALERQVDPTVCVNCRQDAGATELPKVAGLPVCGPCETFFRNRPFPAWIKAALAAVLVLVMVSLVWNLRFFGVRHPLSYVLLWLGISIGMHAFPSIGDAQSLLAQAKQEVSSFHLLAVVTYPLVWAIYLANMLRVFWLDYLYGVGLGLPALIF